MLKYMIVGALACSAPLMAQTTTPQPTEPPAPVAEPQQPAADSAAADTSAPATETTEEVAEATTPVARETPPRRERRRRPRNVCANPARC